MRTKSLFIAMMLVAVTFTAGCMTTGRELAQQAAPAPKSYAEAFATCVEGNTQNPAIVAGCDNAVQADASRSVGVANAAADSNKTVVVIVPDERHRRHYHSRSIRVRSGRGGATGTNRGGAHGTNGATGAHGTNR